MSGWQRNTLLRILLIGSWTGVEETNIAASFASEFEVDFAPTEALAHPELRERVADVDVILIDAASPRRGDRCELVKRALACLLEVDPELTVVTLVRDADAETAAAAISAGAWDVATPSEASGLAQRLRAVAGQRPRQRGATPSDVEARREMVGTSPLMRQVFSLIRQVAASDVPVLLTGESGTGKELAALAIHERSQRAMGPFAPINCAAIPETLLESELFGHERGAFTGAIGTTRGMVEAAEGGTLFLDEIGEMSAALQAKLLRFLEDHVVERIGGRKRFTVDARVIAATNRDLTRLVEQGAFREDLYYRLAVFCIPMPPLRARPEDVLLMARIYLQRYAGKAERHLRGFSADAVDALWKYHWPGNVRELINRIRRAVVVAEGTLVTAVDLDLEGGRFEVPVLTLREAQVRSEIECVRMALERTQGNRSEAARVLNVSRSTLYDLLRRHGLDAENEPALAAPRRRVRLLEPSPSPSRGVLVRSPGHQGRGAKRVPKLA
jgi:two-component system NtrC family response regulator